MRTQEEGRASTAIENPAAHPDQSYPDQSTLARIVHPEGDFVQNSYGLRAGSVPFRRALRLLCPLIGVAIAVGILAAAVVFARVLVDADHTGWALISMLIAAALVAAVLPVGRRS